VDIMENSLAVTLLRQWRHTHLLLADEWLRTPAEVREELAQAPDRERLLDALVAHRLLTPYQAERIRASAGSGLVLGNYRVLDHVGGGRAGSVYSAEHIRLRNRVAVKILPVPADTDASLLERFYGDVRAVTELHHPNLAAVIDAGEAPGEGADAPVLHYVVTEFIPGCDLREQVRAHGPLAPAEACDLAYQLSGALAEAHGRKLTHGHIGPTKVRRRAEGQAVLLDFGLAGHLRRRWAEPGASPAGPYTAPEQLSDPTAADARTDIYQLGATLFWCLTGREPPAGGPEPPSVRALRPDCPAELDDIVTRMLAPARADRFPSAQALMRALLGFLKHGAAERASEAAGRQAALSPAGDSGGLPTARVLIVDDEPGVRLFCRYCLQAEGLRCDEAADGHKGLAAFRAGHYDLVLLDIDMPVMNGLEVCECLRGMPTDPHLKVIMFSGRVSSDELAQMLLTGADDYLVKPFSAVQLRSRVQAALRLRQAQERSDLLNRQLLVVNRELERGLSARDSDLVQARNALVLALAKLAEYRDTETGAHLLRLRQFSCRLAESAARRPGFAGQIDANFLEMLAGCAPLHDIGKVGLPDRILLKPGKLEPEERAVMQTHTVIGASTLCEVARQHGFALVFLQMAVDIARHHHERFDGRGYPDRLAGSAIPLSARLVAVADVYDALRSRRVYKPAMSHAETLQLIQDGFGGHFDPALQAPFLECAADFERIYGELAD
jgi:response regulator RpfG family c-di-GMP phosphodiesterase